LFADKKKYRIFMQQWNIKKQICEIREKGKKKPVLKPAF